MSDENLEIIAFVDSECTDCERTLGMEASSLIKDHVAGLVASLAVAVLLCVAYSLALPRPLPGIPYNKEASWRLFGDLREMKNAEYRREWVYSQPRKHGTPVAQLFLFPFRRPSVVVTDYHEVVDICSRRSKEFDRGTRNKECVGFTAPNFHFTMESRDPRFSDHKELIKDLMRLDFLKEVSAPRVYERVTALVDLWDLKSNKAGGRPFSASHDLYLATMDIICSVAFSMKYENSALHHEINHVRSLNHGLSRILDEPVEFPFAPMDRDVEALLDIPVMVMTAQSSPFPKLAQMMALLKPKHARAQWNRRALLRRQTDKSVLRLSMAAPDRCQSALDQLLWREMQAARRSDRKPDFHSPEIRDEVLGFLLAGHDTTATVASWWIKYMSRHQASQRRLRDELRQAHITACHESRWPTAEEICNASIPYLDAVVEETLRCASVATLIIRTATCDTHILGYPIPKDTDIILALKGPSLTEPALEIPEALRSPAFRDAKSRTKKFSWGDDVGQFEPERWLKMDERRMQVFDLKAGPNLAFSAGLRQCFGKRLAYMELKMLATILLWNFEFEPLSDALGDMDIAEKFVNMPKHCYAKIKRL